MKTIIFSVLGACLLTSCRSDYRKAAEINFTDNAVACLSPSDSEPTLPLELVKFVPPVISDEDAKDVLHGAPAIPEKNKKIIRDGSLSVKVNDPEAAKRNMDQLVKNHRGYYENEEFSNNEQNSSYDLKVRVPSKEFERFLAAAESSEGEVTFKNINARDVTEEYVDGEIRLESKRAFRKRYYDLLQKAAKVDDILSIEENIRVLQEEIESQEGRLKFLDDQVSYSTLSIRLFKEKEPAAAIARTFGGRVKDHLGYGFEALMNGVLWCIKGWPWFPIVILLVILMKRYLRRRKMQRRVV